ncbi:Na+/H+ antiporter subunit E [Arthrobacter sp. MYb227]|uniref:Na+/H+ antiporter subunit E n=1 Tax=Arthrobacter sp. MYb227 TaxID=1848601 RepID=UPI000CFE134F|nr:Na+/H+ antiporter subunit E [Arthrobacter sp. MYb227]PQZ96370.1 Na+/H+ antiporter subunit E [Arthrobacter sp. MYb227]
MSPVERLSDAKNESGQRQRATLRQELPLLLWMVLVWGALWQDFSPGNLVFGLILSLIVVNVFQLPPVILSGRFNIFRAVTFLGRFLWDVVLASFEVMYLAIFRGPKTKSAVIAVCLRTESDLIMTGVGHVLTLVPGSYVVEVDRRSSTLYLHVLNVNAPEDAEQARQDVMDIEARLIRMMGSKEELEALNAEPKHTKSKTKKISEEGKP